MTSRIRIGTTAGAAIAVATLAATSVTAGHVAAAAPWHATRAASTTHEATAVSKHVPKPANNTIAVADGRAIQVYAPGAHGNVAPIRTIKGKKTTLKAAYSIDFDKAGDIWVADIGRGDVVEFGADAHGNASPIFTIPAADPVVSGPDGLTMSANGKSVWIGNDDSTYLSKYSTTKPAVDPLRVIAGADTGISFSHDMALNANGQELWQAGPTGLREFAAKSHVTDQTPIRVIADTDGASHYYEGISVDRSGNVWTADPRQDALYQFGSGSDGTPTQTIEGAATRIASASYTDLGPTGDIWLASQGDQDFGPSIEAFGPNANGDVKPAVRIAGKKTGLTFPNDVALFVAKPTVPRKLTASTGKGPIQLAWKAPKNTGGGLLGYFVGYRTAGPGLFNLIGSTKKRTFSVSTLPSGTRYEFAVIALNELGDSAFSNKASGKQTGQ